MAKRHEDKHDQAVEDSFPASDPPASSGIVGPRAHPPRKPRASHERGDDARPKGTPNHDRHATELEEKPGVRPGFPLARG